jgi:hypothetical protein
VLAVLCILVYLLMYVRGKQANVQLMERFYRKVVRCLEANFAHVGFTKTSGEAPFNGESPSESTYYASGRENVDGIEMRFNVKMTLARPRSGRTCSTEFSTSSCPTATQ